MHETVNAPNIFNNFLVKPACKRMTLFSRKTFCSVKLQSFVNLTFQGKYDRSSGRTDRFKNFTNYINIGKFGIIFW